MNFSYILSEEDLVAWYDFIRQSMPSVARQRRRYVTNCAAIYFSLAVLVTVMLQTWLAGLVAITTALATALFTPRSYDRQVNAALRAQAADPSLKGCFGKHEVSVSEAGLQEVTPTTELRVKWEAVSEVVLARDYLFLRFTAGNGLAISRRSYSGAVAFEDLPAALYHFKKG